MDDPGAFQWPHSPCTVPAHQWIACAPYQCALTPDLYSYNPQQYCIVCHLVEPAGPLVVRSGQPIWIEVSG